MATVWIAEDPLLSRRVAVKLLLPQLAVDDALRVRFRNEAIAAAKLTHPGIVATYDTGDDDGTAYIVMELVEGKTLRRLIDEHGKMPVRDAVDISSQVADALEHAHRQGLVHRDIKPANVLVQPDGRVKVTDFGIAKAAGGDDLTRTGHVVGTARYLAPEQVDGQSSVDGRADVYALGLILYEMLTGKPPFGGDTEMATAVARLTNAPAPVREGRPEVSRPLEDVVARSLARDPEYRYQSAQAFKDALAPGADTASTGDLAPTGALAPPPPPRATAKARAAPARRDAPPPQPRPAPVPPRRGRRWPWVVLILVLLAAGAAAAFALASRDGDSDAGGGASPSAVADNQTLPIVSVSDFDPEGDDGSENPDAVGNAFDGNPSTAWSTSTYQAPATEFGNSKSGVGLIFELDGPHEVSAVSVNADDSEWSADVYVSDQSGSDLPAWGQPRASKQGLGREALFPVDPNASGRFVLLWLTRLPTDGKLGINEVAIAGR
jgi:eukaryotic-like serine/threonine-protein kinase